MTSAQRSQRIIRSFYSLSSSKVHSDVKNPPGSSGLDGLLTFINDFPLLRMSPVCFPRGHSGPTSYSASVSAASLDWEGYKYLMSPPARSALKMQCRVRQSLRRLKHRFALSRQRTVIPNTKYEGKQFTLRLGGWVVRPKP